MAVRKKGLTIMYEGLPNDNDWLPLLEAGVLLSDSTVLETGCRLL